MFIYKFPHPFLLFIYYFLCSGWQWHDVDIDIVSFRLCLILGKLRTILCATCILVMAFGSPTRRSHNPTRTMSEKATRNPFSDKFCTCNGARSSISFLYLPSLSRCLPREYILAKAQGCSRRFLAFVIYLPRFRPLESWTCDTCAWVVFGGT